jgi:molecular chaperone DnaK (HSP70)
VRIYEIAQLVTAGDVARRPILPSFLYITDPAQRDSGAVSLPWDGAPDLVAGSFARDEGALVPARQIASAKSWLSNPLVDRTAPLLPWGAEDGLQISPVEASKRILAHMREAWNHEHPGDDARLEAHPIVLAVPASFDEEARELTVLAGRDAGFGDLTLLEEPLAALYAWMADHRRELAGAFGDGSLILVCDVGGGTTDFSLVRARTDGGELAFERIAIGEHLLLGGDNLDLALAVAAEARLGEGAKLSLAQRLALRRKCSAAKEQLLAERGPADVSITILGAGRGVVGGGRTVVVTREAVTRALTEGFLPITHAGDLPSRDRRTGLRELGLPYETEPAITRHLAAFLTRAAVSSGLEGGMARPDAVLFNGGFFAPAIARTRILDALESWLGTRPRVLENDHPDSAVAIGAAFYGRLRREPAAARRLLIRAGSARGYYIGVGPASAMCVLPRGTDEGTRFVLERELAVETNRPAAFSLYSSIDRVDPLNAMVAVKEAGLERHAPLVTALRFGKRSRSVPLAVRLTAAFTETGTLELWCESRTTDHRWRLAFHLRGVERDPLDDDEHGEGAGTAGAVGEAVIADEALERASAMIREAFGPGAPGPPDALTADLENTLGHGKHAWPLGAIRRLADVLLELEAGRRKSAAHEVRWLNLTGFCVRPGFGSSLDNWRVSELRKVYAAGLAFPREVQNQVEAIVLWQRVSAGFNAGQQRELAQRISGQLGLGQRKPPRINPQIEREGLRLLASLERLDRAMRTRLGEQLMERIRREPRNTAWLWAIGRVGARTPFYGPLNAVVAASAAEEWMARLLAAKEITADIAAAVAQIAARTGDPARDLDDHRREAAAARLEAAGFPVQALRLRTVVPPDRADAGRLFGEALPEGLQLGADSG